MASDSRTLKLAILGEVKDLTSSLNTGSKDVQTFGDKIAKFGKVAAVAFAAAGAVAVKFGIDAVKSASDLAETVAKTGEIFGDSASDIEAFAETSAKALGQTKQQALDAASTFAVFGKSAGLAGDDLVKFSTDFTGLASDLASFNNTSPEEAINAIGSALRGEAEPLRRYGVLLNDATLRQAALELGIVNTTKNALTPQQKVLAAQAVIYQQTTTAQGDFARTSEGLANQQRILSAQLENVKTTIGTALLPIVLEITTFFATYLLPIVEKLGQAFAGDGGDSIKSSLGSVVETIKTFVLPIFDGLVSAFNTIRKAISNNSEELKPFFTLIKNIADFIYTVLAPVVGEVLGAAFKVLGGIISGIITIFAKLVSGITAAVNKVKELASALSNSVVGKAVSGIASGIGSVFGGGRALGGPVSGGTSYLVGERGPELFTPSSSGKIIPNNAMGGNTVNITVNGALDPISTARQIANILNREATISGSFNRVGSSLLVGA
jgi:hypothetical protein